MKEYHVKSSILTTKGICATLGHINATKIGTGKQAAPSLCLANSKPDYLSHLLGYLKHEGTD